MQLSATLSTTASVEAVVGYVDDLAMYPSWMSLVHSAEPVTDSEPPAWLVELRAKVGPFARSKRLRMVRRVYERGDTTRIVFERQENDGRQHANWRLEATVTPGASGAGCELVMHLHYDGRFFVGVVEAILQQNIDAGRTRLGELLA